MAKKHTNKSWLDIKIVGFVVMGALLGVLFCTFILYSQTKKGNVVVNRSSAPHVVETSHAIVINTVGAPDELVQALASDDGGCYKSNAYDKQNKYYIQHVDGDFAEVAYGCQLDAKMFYKKTDGKWQGISPTNQFYSGVPLCDMVTKYAIPKTLVSHCFDQHLDENLMPIDTTEPKLIPNPNNA